MRLSLAVCFLFDSFSLAMIVPAESDDEIEDEVKDEIEDAHGTRTCIKRKKIDYGKFFDFCAEKCL